MKVPFFLSPSCSICVSIFSALLSSSSLGCLVGLGLGLLSLLALVAPIIDCVVDIEVVDEGMVGLFVLDLFCSNGRSKVEDFMVPAVVCRCI